jgi:Na+/H+-dicarboxylate symporter
MKKRLEDRVPANGNGIGQALDFIEENLLSMGLERKQVNQSMMLAEECMVRMVENVSNPEKDTIQLHIKKVFGTIKIRLACRGQEFILAGEELTGVSVDDIDEMGLETQSMIQSMLFSQYRDKLRYKHKNQLNTVQILVQQSSQKTMYRTLTALLCAIIVGFILRLFAPAEFNDALNTYVLSAVRTVYMNGLGVLVGPVVFFSLVSCISQFSDLSAFGRIGGRVMLTYIFTSIVALFVGTGVYFLIHPTGSMAIFQGTATMEAGEMVSLYDTILNIVPSNFVAAFLDADMLQILFLAILIGATLGTLGQKAKLLQDFFEACNELFLKLTVVFSKLIPLIIFCSITSMILTTGTEMLSQIVILAVMVLLGFLLMATCYGCLVAVVGRLNPFIFFRKYLPTALEVLAIGSSNASMPQNMKFCEEKMGISKQVYAFSIPLGATINMDGGTVETIALFLFVANTYGLHMTPSFYITLFVTTLLLTMGTPGVAGAGIIAYTVLFTQFDIPLTAMSLIITLDSLVDMFATVSNTMGDVCATTIVARSQGMIDVDVYNSK